MRSCRWRCSASLWPEEAMLASEFTTEQIWRERNAIYLSQLFLSGSLIGFQHVSITNNSQSPSLNYCRLGFLFSHSPYVHTNLTWPLCNPFSLPSPSLSLFLSQQWIYWSDCTEYSMTTNATHTHTHTAWWETFIYSCINVVECWWNKTDLVFI